MKKIAFSSHVALIKDREYDGIGNSLIETLASITDKFIFVRHSMDGKLPSEVRYYKKDAIDRKVKLAVISKIGPLRYITEWLATVLYFTFREKVDIYVGVDPLNAAAGITLKKLGRVKEAIFYTADYSPKRFESKMLNNIYHALDRYCVKNADEVWSVSTRIMEIRKNMGLPDEKNIFLPNVPPTEYNEFRKNPHNKPMLVMHGLVGTQLDYEGTIQAVAKLKKDIPDIGFTIVGSGPEEDRLKALAKKLGVAKNVIFKGRRSLVETLDVTSRCGIGLALYTGEWGFNEFGDSTKCREYFHYALPVISTDTHSTVGEIQESGAGVIVEKNVDSYVKAILEILDHYDKYSRASGKLGRKYEGIHKKRLLRIVR